MRSLGHYGIGNETESEVRILEALKNQVTELEFNEEPLENVMAIIGERHNIQIAFDRRALEDESIDPSSDAVTIDISNVRLQSALNLMLRDLNLTAVVRDEVLMITTMEAAEEILETRLYAIPSYWPLAPKELIEAITMTAVPSSWNSVGGPGTVSSVKGGLIVSNTQKGHFAIRKIFDQLEKLYTINDPATSKVTDRNQRVP